MKSNYDKNPFIKVDNGVVWKGWDDILSELYNKYKSSNKNKYIIVFDFYTGVYHSEIENVINKLNADILIDARKIFKSTPEVTKMTYPDVTDDEIFGYMTRLQMNDFFDPQKLVNTKQKIQDIKSGLVVIYGHGASLISENYDLLVYADMARWEIQQRMRRNEVNGLGIDDKNLPFSDQYKRGYFVDWRVCDKLKKTLFSKMDYILDTNKKDCPKMIEAKTMFEGLEKTANQPFRVQPFFDPGPWGGQWIKEYCDLDKNVDNYAWCFDCVVEENSLLLNVSGNLIEIPAINLVFNQSRKLLGEPVESRFGQEFPIRFDFLDTMDGGNLSLQVHPTTQYIKETFGMDYTQDESYYILDAKEGGTVYLGLKDSTKPKEMLQDLYSAQNGGEPFDAEKYVNKWPAKKHDHFLIPNGTVHCSGKNSMVLEISSTTYIFTFKLWDWGRLGLDGKPRPINIAHGEKVIQWDRKTDYVRDNLINQIERIAEGDGWREEKTGLHKNEFIETRRHWFTKKVTHHTNDSVNVLNLVEGREAIIESPTNQFEPFIVHYAETFIVPANVKEYAIRPYGESEGKEIATIKAYIRF